MENNNNNNTGRRRGVAVMRAQSCCYLCRYVCMCVCVCVCVYLCLCMRKLDMWIQCAWYEFVAHLHSNISNISGHLIQWRWWLSVFFVGTSGMCWMNRREKILVNVQSQINIETCKLTIQHPLDSASCLISEKLGSGETLPPVDRNVALATNTSDGPEGKSSGGLSIFLILFGTFH